MRVSWAKALSLPGNVPSININKAVSMINWGGLLYVPFYHGKEPLALRKLPETMLSHVKTILSHTDTAYAHPITTSF